MTIIERNTDMAGKYRVLVEVNTTRAIPLKYDNIVEDSIVFADAQGVLDREVIQNLEPLNFEL